ncbi:uncharacterized protein LOC112089954 [Eutrema salsugineum]|uniref:uncharacterized protein LOC112089954 n=1 Tax=Eutrema salsugineum TaxID=72664 RepID=UPI0002BD281C|nr:uncharacterized protein LOC112089954 [Eutrema salsugineum]
MVIKRIEMCIEMVKIAKELVVVVSEAVRVFLSNAPPTPPALLRHGPYHYSASFSHPSPYIIGYLP